MKYFSTLFVIAIAINFVFGQYHLAGDNELYHEEIQHMLDSAVARHDELVDLLDQLQYDLADADERVKDIISITKSDLYFAHESFVSVYSPVMEGSLSVGQLLSSANQDLIDMLVGNIVDTPACMANLFAVRDAMNAYLVPAQRGCIAVDIAYLEFLAVEYNSNMVKTTADVLYLANNLQYEQEYLIESHVYELQSFLTGFEYYSNAMGQRSPICHANNFHYLAQYIDSLNEAQPDCFSTSPGAWTGMFPLQDIPSFF